MTTRIPFLLSVCLVLLAVFRSTPATAQCGSPRIDCPADIEAKACDPGGAILHYPVPTASNDCGPLDAMLLFGPPPGGLFPLGVTTVGYRAVDADGGFVECSFRVTVTTQRMQIDCPPDIYVKSCSANGATVEYPTPLAFGDCGPLDVVLHLGPPSGGIFPVGTTTVEWRTVPDNVGSYTLCTFTVTVDEQADLGIFCPDDITVTACEADGATVTYEQPTATSRCGPLDTFLHSGLPSGALFPVGTNNVTWRTDQEPIGYFTFCSFTVTVLPLIPSMSCPSDTTVTTCDPAGAVVEYVVPTASTPCGPLETFLSTGLPPGARFPIGHTTSRWLAGPLPDGSFAFCEIDVTVAPGPDTTPPVILCPEDQFLVASPGQNGAIAEWEVKTSDDCSDAVTVLSQPPSGSTFPCGTTSVTVTATDETGNAATCQFDVTVALPVAFDVRPGGCPNPIKTSENGVIPVAIMGSGLFDVNRIEPASVRLEGVSPVRWAHEDVGAPFLPLVGKDDCLDCNALKKDRIGDLTFKFSAPALVAALGKVTDQECRVVRLTGRTTDGCPVTGEDVIRLLANSDQLASVETTVSIEAAPAARRPTLHAARPNPLSEATEVHYELPIAARTRLEIFDVVGRRVRSIVDEVQAPGSHSATWDATDEAGVPVTNGVYFYALAVEGGTPFRQVRKLIVSR